MNSRVIKILKVVVFVACLAPLFVLVHRFRTDNLGSDPVATITHFTGNWAVYFLLGGLAITPVRRLSPKLGWLVRFRRMIGLYAFFYATLHLLTYVLLFSGFDLPGAWDNLRAHQFAAIAQKFRDVWPTMLDDLKKRTFIQIGLLAWFSLLALAAHVTAVGHAQNGRQAVADAPPHRLWRHLPGAAALQPVGQERAHRPLRDMMILFALLAARPAWQWFDRRRRAATPQPALRVSSEHGRASSTSPAAPLQRPARKTPRPHTCPKTAAPCPAPATATYAPETLLP